MDDIASLFDLGGQVALVTGASSGIGRAMATTLAAAGATVICVARREAELAATCEAIVAEGGTASALAIDLLADDAMARLREVAAARHGPPDILVNAAGVNFRQSADAVTRESWDATLALNLTVPFFLARELVPAMRDRGRGKIINIASLQSVRAFANGIAYGASKGGVAQLTRAMAEAWSCNGVCANAIAPGFFPTGLTAPVFERPELAAELAARSAVGRNGEMQDLRGATVFLASRAADYVTGQILFVDGGFTAK